MSNPFLTVAPVQSEELDNREQRHEGPLKKVIANSDSLYKYINWEDPVRTAGSYVFALSALLSVHYLPLTQIALKYGAITLGAVSAIEYAHRSFTSNTIIARMRPREYKRIPDSTLDDTLRDVHDLAQWGVVKAQRILFAQNLAQTFYAFLALSSLYWLIKLVPPFGLAIIALNTIYIAPLLASPRGREVAQDLAENTKAKANELSSKAQATAADTQRQLGNLTEQAQNKASELTDSAKQTVNDFSQKSSKLAQQASEKTKATAADAQRQLGNLTGQAQNQAANVTGAAKQTVNDLPQKTSNLAQQAQNKAGELTGSAKDTASDLPQKSSNVAQQASEGTKATADDAKQRIHAALYGDSKSDAYSNRDDKPSDTVSSTAKDAGNKVSDLAGNATETVKQNAPNNLFNTGSSHPDTSSTNPFRHSDTPSAPKYSDVTDTDTDTGSGQAGQAAPFGNNSTTHYTLEPTTRHSGPAPSSIPRGGAVDHLGPIPGTVSSSVGEVPTAPSVLDRPRGVTKLPGANGL